MSLFEKLRLLFLASPAGEIDEELRSHIQHRADDLERTGMARREAERRARVEFGGYVHYREDSHVSISGRTRVFFETLMQDMRFALRILRKSPGFTAAAIVTLALAIGANAVVFGIMDGLILRSLQVPQPETLYGTEYGDGAGWQSYPNYVDLRDRNHSFDSLAAFNFAFTGFDTGNDPAPATGFAVTGNYFDVLRLQPSLGKFFHASDEHGANSAPYVVLSYPYWHTRFQDDRNVVGRVVRLDKQPFTIMGVAPQGFSGTLLFVSADFFIPMVNQSQVGSSFDVNARGNQDAIFEVMGHLKPGVTPEMALADMKSVRAYLDKTYPGQFAEKPSRLSRTGLTSFGGPVRAFVAGLMLLSGLILLAACANLGSLFAAHAADRSREVALRLALGSSRTRILRQLVTEAILISLAGGAFGLAGSVVLLRRLSTWNPFSGAPIHLPVAPDASVYVMALGLALVSGFLFGIVPVRQVLRANPYEVIKAGPGARLGRRITVRDVLLAIQIAICAVLITSSMVALRGLMRSLHSNFGFEPQNSLLVGADLAMGGYTIDKVPAMQKRLVDALQTVPGVEAAGLVNGYPPLIYGAAKAENIYRNETTDLRQSNISAAPYKYDVSPGYFRAAATSFLTGRDFSWHDDSAAPAVAVVNRDLATKMFGSVSGAVGSYMKLQDGTRVQVIGVVEDGKYLSVTEDQHSAMFMPSLRAPIFATYVIVRSHRDRQQLTAAIRSKLHTIDEGLPVTTDSWNDLLAVVLFPSRVATVALGALGIMGAMLSITGIFGMAAYSVNKRLRELGIRVALGAQRREVLKTALGRAVKLLAIGSAAGLILGILATKVLAFIVYQATPRDPVVLAGVVVAMSLLGLVATWIPAQRALSVDPMMLLREE